MHTPGISIPTPNTGVSASVAFAALLLECLVQADFNLACGGSLPIYARDNLRKSASWNVCIDNKERDWNASPELCWYETDEVFENNVEKRLLTLRLKQGRWKIRVRGDTYQVVRGRVLGHTITSSSSSTGHTISTSSSFTELPTSPTWSTCLEERAPSPRKLYDKPDVKPPNRLKSSNSSAEYCSNGNAEFCSNSNSNTNYELPYKPYGKPDVKPPNSVLLVLHGDNQWIMLEPYKMLFAVIQESKHASASVTVPRLRPLLPPHHLLRQQHPLHLL
ncbi:hypothetical protein CYMTET_12179 [Cymbomonas tetramitiformis]|uniref:Uncharacterized protein n=1 Tax=Cymbomonas tetramitiformis TaxID=36881 RepID=A0AAE0GL02_9CHLO|nr:hypothetical protein CYMTET_12179 [Cymbomonas tetramitiformis]